jgi:TonB family protein
VKRLALLVLAVVVVVVAYAAVGEGRTWPRLLEWFEPKQHLPALRTSELPFRYPAHLWRQGVEGEVVLRIHITQDGAVDSVELESSSGYGQLDEIAIRGASQLEYHPARQGEKGVAVWAVLPVRFERSATSPPAEGTDDR